MVLQGNGPVGCHAVTKWVRAAPQAPVVASGAHLTSLKTRNRVQREPQVKDEATTDRSPVRPGQTGGRFLGYDPWVCSVLRLALRRGQRATGPRPVSDPAQRAHRLKNRLRAGGSGAVTTSLTGKNGTSAHLSGLAYQPGGGVHIVWTMPFGGDRTGGEPLPRGAHRHKPTRGFEDAG